MRPTVRKHDRRFNRALLGLVEGRYPDGGPPVLLSVLTGLTPEAIRGRVADARNGYQPDPLPPGTGLDGDDRAYHGRRFGSVQDPEIREFLSSINGSQRKSPDQEDSRVFRQRIRTKDGKTKLIAISKGLIRN